MPHIRRICLSGFTMLVLFSASAWADPTDPFDAANKAPVLSAFTNALTKAIDFDIKLSTAKATRGAVVRLTITGSPAKSYYTYALNQRTDKQGENDLQFKYAGVPGLKALWPIEESTPKLALLIDGSTAFEHSEQFTWTQDLYIAPQTKPGQYELVLTIDKLSVCNKDGCLVPAPYRPLYVHLEIVDGAAAPPPADLAKRLEGPPPAKSCDADQGGARRPQADRRAESKMATASRQFRRPPWTPTIYGASSVMPRSARSSCC